MLCFLGEQGVRIESTAYILNKAIKKSTYFAKKGAQKVKRFLSVLGCVLLLAACTQNEKITVYDEQNDKTKEIKHQLENSKEVDKANIVVIDDEILVAIQVKPWLSFKEQKTEKEIQERLTKEMPHYDILVSSDFKLYWETSKLIDEKDHQNVNQKVKDLKKLAKEET